MFKSIYEFEIQKEVEVDKVETREENGSTISVTTKVKENKPTYFAIKRPSRNEKEEGEMNRAAHFALCVERGVITQAALRKKYGDTGGIYTNEEEKQYAILRQKLRDLLEDYQLASVDLDKKTEEEKKRRNEIFDEIFEIRRKIIEFENSATLFYQDTAESKARNKLIEFFILNLTYWKTEKDKEWVPFFKGNTLEEKLAYLCDLEDNDDEIYLKIGEKLAFVVTLLLTSPNLTKEEIESIEKETA